MEHAVGPCTLQRNLFGYLNQYSLIYKEGAIGEYDWLLDGISSQVRAAACCRLCMPRVLCAVPAPAPSPPQADSWASTADTGGAVVHLNTFQQVRSAPPFSPCTYFKSKAGLLLSPTDDPP
jgi:hypothetical protein